MDRRYIFQRQFLETFIATLRQRYPGLYPIVVEKNQEQIVVQLNQFVVTITSKGTVEIAAPTNSHQQVERLAIEIEQLLSQIPPRTQGLTSR